jgi:selenide,water dikinase
LLVGIETSDDAAVYRLNDQQALIATTDFFMPIVDDPRDFGRIAATNAISDVYAMGGTPIMALALVGMPIDKLPVEIIGRILEGGESVCAAAGNPDCRRPHHRFGGADLRPGRAGPGASRPGQDQCRCQSPAMS